MTDFIEALKHITPRQTGALTFVGDSLMRQQFVSLLHLLNAQPTAVAHRPASTAAAHRACGGRVRLLFVRNDYLCDPSWSRECHSTTK